VKFSKSDEIAGEAEGILDEERGFQRLVGRPDEEDQRDAICGATRR
jgi:hypothetical protein